MSTEVETLGRIIASENDRGATLAELRAVGWVARNRARKRKQTIVQMAHPPAAQGKGRPFSSARPATAKSLAAARHVLTADAAADPTQGATSCFQPFVQDRLFASGRYKHDATSVRRRWLRELAYYGSVGSWDLFGRKGGPGAKPTPPSWGIDEEGAPPSRGPVARLEQPSTAALGGFPWLLLLLFGLRFTRR